MDTRFVLIVDEMLFKIQPVKKYLHSTSVQYRDMLCYMYVFITRAGATFCDALGKSYLTNKAQ